MGDSFENPSRRRVLRLLGVGGISGIAGCPGQSGSPTQTVPAGETETKTPANGRTSSPTDSEDPTIETSVANPAPERGVLRFQLKATDNTAIRQATVMTPTAEVITSFDGRATVDLQDEIKSIPGQVSTVSFQATDTGGNTARTRTSTYARAYDIVRSSDIDFGATYQLHPTQTGLCVNGQPAIGRYDSPTQDIVNHHVDQLQSAGFSHVAVQIDDQPDVEATRMFTNAQLGKVVGVEFRYGFLDWLLEDVSLDTQLEIVTDAIGDVPTYATHNERPIIALRRLQSIQSKDGPVHRTWKRLFDEYGGVSGFVNHLRTELTHEGTEPFLIGEVEPPSFRLIDPRRIRREQYRRLLQQLDAVRNRMPLQSVRPDSSDPWATISWRLRDAFRVLRLFADEHDIEFIPLVIPGIHTSPEDCQSQRVLPRDLDQFYSLLEYAARYTTMDRVTVGSFNDWQRGTQIEEGTFDGSAYGRRYLDQVTQVSKQRGVTLDSDRTVYHVKPDGKDWQSGAETNPLQSIQEGVMRATPGDTIQVHPGEYQEGVRTVRAGTSEKPITITGPKEAVLRGPVDGSAIWIKHSHIRVIGLTINGLLDPANPEDVSSYSTGDLVRCAPPATTDSYLQDIVFAPAAIGNSERALAVFTRTTDLEIGPFRVIGPAGAGFLYGDRHAHVGEIVYLGTPPNTIDKVDYPWDQIDQSRNIYVHHIDNSAGHPHSELVNTKLGTHDVRIEYCTDGGGSQNEEPYPAATIRCQSYDATIRWCDLQAGEGDGILIDGGGTGWLRERDDPPIAPDRIGTEHAVYGNQIQDYDNYGLRLAHATADEQDVLCGNDVTGRADDAPESTCPGRIPDGDGIGHRGGNKSR